MKQFTRTAVVTAALVIGFACSSQRMAAKPDLVEVLNLQHIDAVAAAAQIETATSRARVATNPRTNSLIVSGSPRQIEQVRQIVSRIDKPS